MNFALELGSGVDASSVTKRACSDLLAYLGIWQEWSLRRDRANRCASPERQKILQRFLEKHTVVLLRDEPDMWRRKHIR